MSSLRTDLAILKDRAVRRLLCARVVSLLGNAIMPVALSFAVLGLPGGTATDLGLVLATRMVAQLVFVLLGGVIADRLPRYRVMIGADLAAAVIHGLLAFVVVAGAATPLLLAGLAALSGAAAALFEPASRSVIPQLVPAESLQSANALLKLSMRGGSILGAAVSGVLVATIGAGYALAVDAATFVLSAVLLVGVAAPPAAAVEPSGTLFAQLLDGWREFTARRWVWVAVGQMALVNMLLAGAFYVLGPVVAERSLGGAPGWGVVLAVQAVGFVVGTGLAIRLRPRRPVLVAALSTVLFPLSLFSLAAGAPLLAVAVAVFAAALAIDVYEVLVDTALQQHVPPEALSRVMSYEALGSLAFVPLGAAIVGPVSGQVGVPATLVWAGAFIVLAGVVMAALPSVRAVTARPEDTPAPATPGPESGQAA
ncbi:MFS transporter [Amycolatopsis sp. cmx-4-68]|uniref:MFS transporter n=1 Tax=Amycolatopsis sp. cmx-4-68 TaxID=2790938 RepID=UPI0039783D79